MMTDIMHDQNLEKHIEKQMGCMAGFLQIFDRHQFLIGKRLYSPKRLPPPSQVDSTPESEKSVGSPAMTPATELRSPMVAPPADNSTKLSHPFPTLEFKEGTRSSWKFRKEAPRLSLDSRASVDAKGSLYPREIRSNAAILSANRRENNTGGGLGGGGDGDGDEQRRSPGVIARLMGLEPLPNAATPEPIKKAELRRSASESRVSRDLFQSRFIDEPIKKAESETRRASPNYAKARCDSKKVSPWKSHQQRKSFFDSEDLFPEPKRTVTIYGEIEKRLKTRGIDEPSHDLEALKQILEAMQLKGLLHSTNKPSLPISRKNIVYDHHQHHHHRRFSSQESPIVLMRPVRTPPVSPIKRRMRSESPPPPSSLRCRADVRRSLNFSPTVSPRRERHENYQNAEIKARSRNSRSPIRSENNAKASNSVIKQKPLSVETRRKRNESMEQQRRVSPIHSPKLNSNRFVSNQTTATTRSPSHKNTTAEDESSSNISESGVTTCSQTDTEGLQRSRMEENKEGGRSILERCDQLLHSIAEMNATELQPSPVSVLDSFYKDEPLSPSPIMKRSIDFKDQLGEGEEEIWIPAISSFQAISGDQSDDCDFVYVSKILQASHYLPDDSDIFLLLEKQQYVKGKDTSKVSRLQRRLIFDTITEILDRNKQLPPWKALSGPNSSVAQPTLDQIWTEFQRIQERETGENLLEIICGVLKKDLVGDAINGWDDCPMEMSEAVLDIERLIFKDVIGETIQDFTEFSVKITVAEPCRKLVF